MTVVGRSRYPSSFAAPERLVLGVFGADVTEDRRDEFLGASGAGVVEVSERDDKPCVAQVGVRCPQTAASRSLTSTPLRPAMFAPKVHGRLPSGVMIYQGRHHTAEAYPELLAWLEYLKVSNKRPRTLEAYERNVAGLLLQHQGRKFADFDDSHILSFLAQAPERSRHIYKAPINQWFKWGYRTRRLTWNPADLLPDIRYRPNRNIRTFTDAERAAMRTLDDPNGLLMLVLLETGLRNQEARFLKVKRVDFDGQELLVREGAKGGKERVVPLTTACAGALHELITTYGLGPEEHFWCSHPGGGHRTKRDTPVSHSTFQRWWTLCLEEAGVEYRKPHTTRHSFATYWLDVIDDGEVQDMLGHESIRTTRDIYQHRNVGRTGDKMRRHEESLNDRSLDQEHVS